MSTSPAEHPELYDTCVVAGVRSPGLVTFSGHDREWKWDVKDGDGQDGASCTRKGKALAQFKATFELWSGFDAEGRPTRHFPEWDAFAEMLQRAADAEPLLALDIYHPDLERVRIRAVQVRKVYGLAHDKQGGAVGVVDFLEYAPPKPKSGTAQGSKGNPAGGGSGAPADGTAPPPDPNADAQAEIDRLLDEAQEP